MRLHPDTGNVVDADAKAPGVQIDVPLACAMEDVNEGKPARIVGAAYTNISPTTGTAFASFGPVLF